MPRLQSTRMLVAATILLGSGLVSATRAPAASVTCFGKRAGIVGTQGPDRLFGDDGSDIIAGLGGNDRIYGGDGGDLICGDDGRDVIYAGRGDDVVLGGVDGLPDRIYGGPGDDYLSGDGGLHGGSGDDALFTNYGNTVHDILDGGPGNDLVRSHSDNPVTLIGGPGNDRLYGRAGRDYLSGGPGNDVIHSTSTGDRIDCGSGHDTVYAPRGAAIEHCEVIHYRARSAMGLRGHNHR